MLPQFKLILLDKNSRIVKKKLYLQSKMVCKYSGILFMYWLFVDNLVTGLLCNCINMKYVCSRENKAVILVHGPDDFRWTNWLTKAPYDFLLKYILKFKKNRWSSILGFVFGILSNLKSNLSFILSPPFKIYIC